MVFGLLLTIKCVLHQQIPIDHSLWNPIQFSINDVIEVCKIHGNIQTFVRKNAKFRNNWSIGPLKLNKLYTYYELKQNKQHNILFEFN